MCLGHRRAGRTRAQPGKRPAPPRARAGVQRRGGGWTLVPLLSTAPSPTLAPFRTDPGAGETLGQVRPRSSSNPSQSVLSRKTGLSSSTAWDALPTIPCNYLVGNSQTPTSFPPRPKNSLKSPGLGVGRLRYPASEQSPNPHSQPLPEADKRAWGGGWSHSSVFSPKSAGQAGFQTQHSAPLLCSPPPTPAARTHPQQTGQHPPATEQAKTQARSANMDMCPAALPPQLAAGPG